jgi:hypothetical protein
MVLPDFLLTEALFKRYALGNEMYLTFVSVSWMMVLA